MPKAKKKIIKSTQPPETVEQYLARGGEITVCEPGARTEDLYVGQWGRRKAAPKKAESKESGKVGQDSAE